LIVCLIPTTIGRIAQRQSASPGIDRLMPPQCPGPPAARRRAAGDVDVLPAWQNRAPSPWATAWPRSSFPPRAFKIENWPTPPKWRRWRTKPPKAAPIRRPGQGKIRLARARCHPRPRPVCSLHRPKPNDEPAWISATATAGQTTASAKRGPNPFPIRRATGRSEGQNRLGHWWRKSPASGAHFRWSWPTNGRILGVIRLKDIVKGRHQGAVRPASQNGRPAPS